MPSQDGFADDLYAAVLAGTGHEGGGSFGQTYVCLDWPGLPIEAADFADALTADNLTGSPTALEAFSTLVDELPALAPIHTETGFSLEAVYGMILGATVAGGTAVARAFADAKERYDGLVRSSLQAPLDVFHPCYAQPRTWADPAGASNWATVRVGAAAPPPPRPLPPILTKAIAGEAGKAIWRFNGQTPPIVVRPRPEIVLRRAPAPPAAAALPSARPGAPGAVLAPVARMPAALQAARLSTSALRPDALTPAVGGGPVLRPDLAKRLGAGVIPVSPRPPPAPEQRPATSPGLRVTLRTMRIDIKRPWFEPLLLRLPGWSLDGIQPGFFSEGTGDTDGGPCPLIPTSVIAVRDVEITGDWSAEDQAAARRAVGGAGAAFGPLTVATGGRSQARFDGSALVIPGIQIVAWICNRVPLLPP